MTKEQRQILTLTCLGGLLEFYDFIIYALLAGYISVVFFPETDAFNALLATFATYAAGYVARPLGGVVFGHFGDIYGRKKTFTVSILLMGIATFLVGVIPDYKTAGVIAPVLLVSLRILQGISVGGEIPGALTYISESLPDKKGLATGMLFTFLVCGVCVGYIVQALMLHIFTNDQILEWAWRIPFFIGGIFGWFAYVLRRKLTELPGFSAYIGESSLPVVDMMKRQGKALILGTIVTSYGAALFVLSFIFLPAYLMKVLHYSLIDFVWTSTLSVFIVALCCTFIGKLSDRIGRVKILAASLIGTLFASPIAFHIYVSAFDYHIVALVLSIVVTGLAWGSIPPLLSELFDHDIRYSGIGLAYNVGFAVFGGLIPLIALKTISLSGSLAAPGYILFVAAVVCGLTLLLLRGELNAISE